MLSAKRSIKSFLLILMALFVPLSLVQATEGFAGLYKGAPAVVSSVWESTFALYTDLPDRESHIATAFVIGNVENKNQREIYFLTANHTLNRVCRVGRFCPYTYMARNLYQQLKFGLVQSKRAEGSEFDHIKIIARWDEIDVALVVAIVPLKVGVELRPLTLPVRCNFKPNDLVYSIGFPGLHLRASKSAVTFEQKQWATGVFVRSLASESGQFNFPTFSNDALPGSSGGPIFNAAGEVVSLMSKARVLPETGYAYLGDESPDNLDYHAVGVPCESLVDVGRSVEKSIQSFRAQTKKP